MSEPGQAQATASEPATNAAPRSGAAGGPGRRVAIVAAAGCLLIAAAVGLMLQKADFAAVSGDPAQPTISYVARGDITAAATTRVPSAARPMGEEARSCKITRASLTIAKEAASGGSTS